MSIIITAVMLYNVWWFYDAHKKGSHFGMIVSSVFTGYWIYYLLRV